MHRHTDRLIDRPQTLTPAVCRILATLALFAGCGSSCYLLWGCRYGLGFTIWAKVQALELSIILIWGHRVWGFVGSWFGQRVEGSEFGYRVGGFGPGSNIIEKKPSTLNP